jgi:hypothetical protein
LFLDFLRQFYAADVTVAVSNRLNPSIGSDSKLFYPAMILLDHVVQIHVCG